jgi:hypothetical protein
MVAKTNAGWNDEALDAFYRAGRWWRGGEGRRPPTVEWTSKAFKPLVLKERKRGAGHQFRALLWKGRGTGGARFPYREGSQGALPAV